MEAPRLTVNIAEKDKTLLNTPALSSPVESAYICTPPPSNEVSELRLEEMPESERRLPVDVSYYCSTLAPRPLRYSTPSPQVLRTGWV